MNVLVINGSPRAKGNSDILCDEFIRGAEEAGHQVEKISLREKKIFPCKACYACFRTGSCVQKDDMAEILRKAENADVLLLASPTYFLTMSGQMKVMIDRLLPKWQGLGGKEAYVIVTGHDGKNGLRRNAEDLAGIYIGKSGRSCAAGDLGRICLAKRRSNRNQGNGRGISGRERDWKVLWRLI